jgi:hypothetical protein
MKRMIFPGCIILILASMVFVSYAEMKKIVLSKDNLADLKGKWTGARDTHGRLAQDTDLEIANDSVPVECKFTFYHVRKKGTGPASDTTEIHNFKAKINDQGNLFFTGSKNEVELSLYEDDGKMKLDGNYHWGGDSGAMSFKKQ